MDPNLQIKPNLGCKNLLLRKLSYAVTSSVLSQFVILLIFLFVVNFNILSPVDWLESTLSTLTSPSTWLFVLLFSSIIFAQCLICAKDYVLKPAHYTNRMQTLLSVLSLRNFMLLLLHVLIGGLTVWLFLSLSGVKHNCENKPCLSLETFYLILCGLWTGFYFFVGIHTSKRRILFPVVQQSKLLQYKTKLVPLTKKSLKITIWPTVYYFILYWICGEKFQDLFSEYFHLHIQPERSFGILLHIYAWFFAALYVFNMNLMRFSFEVFLTEPVEFPICTLTKEDLTLFDALTMSNIPIVQHLACLDLFILSYSSKQRREILFALSQPGNHPHNWNLLITNVTRIFSEYTEILNKSTSSILSTKVETTPAITNPPSKVHCYGTLRNMSLPNAEIPLDIVNVSFSRNVPFEESLESMSKKLSEKTSNIMKTVKSRLGIDFLFGELPMSNIQTCLLNGQIIIWTTQAVSNLIEASLKEDRFGVVQKDLPLIISSLVELKQSVEKLNRIPALVRKGHGFNNIGVRMKGAIGSAIKRSLYNICHHFGPYLKDMPLNKDVVQFVHNYVSNKEM